MAMLRRREAGEDAELSMTPLIDAVFLLLIFFLVATMAKKKDRDIAITPPESGSAQKLLADDEAIVVGIDPLGQVYLQGDPSNRNDLMASLGELSVEDPGRQVRVDADQATPFERVAEVLDLLQFRGMTNVVIRTYDDKYNRRR
jgi:biopolymer transport protein ExbD